MHSMSYILEDYELFRVQNLLGPGSKVMPQHVLSVIHHRKRPVLTVEEWLLRQLFIISSDKIILQ
jgi:hypothetical protein